MGSGINPICIIADEYRHFEYFCRHERLLPSGQCYVGGLAGYAKLCGRPRDTRIVAYGPCWSNDSWRSIQMARDMGFKIEFIYEFTEDHPDDSPSK